VSVDENVGKYLNYMEVSWNIEVRMNQDGKIQYYIPQQEGKLLSDNWMDISRRRLTMKLIFPPTAHS
jgi:hypothetical protein